jgi:hypothetical protein
MGMGMTFFGIDRDILDYIFLGSAVRLCRHDME